ncbi:MAG: cobalt-precorrin-5B (C(1))-methyltransferase CbiD [Oscillospiraceae bacterium]
MFSHYFNQGTLRLRCGYTTGSCAALAAKAAAEMLLSGEMSASSKIMTPKGIPVEVDILDIKRENDAVSCAVRKDSGDDIDVTDGILVYAEVKKSAHGGIRIEGGEGVGRVTRDGLEQPKGEAAINRVPRSMIAESVGEICDKYGYRGGIDAVISIPAGVGLAKRTFNPQLGIEGGISVLGTSGIVEPKSLKALCDSIKVEMRVLSANSEKSIIVTPGNYGSDFVAQYPRLLKIPIVQCANFVGDTLDFAAELGFERVLMVGHIGKFIKLAGGIMDTHSRTADCRAEIFAAHAALHGADRQTVRRIMDSATTDECLDIADKCGLYEQIIQSLLERAQYYADRRASGAFECGIVMFSNKRGILGMTAQARAVVEVMEEMK